MNVKIEIINFKAFENLAKLINEYRIEYLKGESKNDVKIRVNGKEVSTDGFSEEILKNIINLKVELNVYWIYSNTSSIFFTLGRWVDASWGIAKVYDPTNFCSPYKNGKIHEWEKISQDEWFYFLHE